MENEKKAKILVVDDELDLLDLYCKRLKRAGFDVVTAANGAEAIQALQASAFDAVVCDINMPVKNGFEVFDFVRMQCAEKKLPFIFVTGHGEGTPEMKTALSLGADDVFSKPVSSKVLINRLQELCGIPQTSPEASS